jgi:hypothetical protein
MATLAELGTISKDQASDDRRRRNAGTAMASGGGVLAATGLAGGGIPGTRPDPDSIKAWKGSKGASRMNVMRAAPGGIFGYREQAHKQYNAKNAADQAHYARKTPTSKLKVGDVYARGKETGKIPVEEKIIRHLKVGRKASYGALAAGSALAATGAHLARRDQRVKKYDREKTDRAGSVMLGGGLAAAGVSQGAASVLGGQTKKWTAAEGRSYRDASAIIPNLRGKRNSDVLGDASRGIKADPKLLKGKSRRQVFDAAKHRGAAQQAKYFSRVYGNHAKAFRVARYPSLALAGAGGALLAAPGAAGRARERSDRRSSGG